MELVLLAAVARNGVIGGNNDLLWRLPEDMRFLRDTTMGHPVIMGRRNIVVSRDAGYAAPGAEVVVTLDDALARVQDTPRAYVLGGAQLYALALPRADRQLLTEIDRDFDGDVHFPRWPRADFEELWRTRHDSGQGFAYERAEYRRRSGS